jgi:hypothetical protein
MKGVPIYHPGDLYKIGEQYCALQTYFVVIKITIDMWQKRMPNQMANKVQIFLMWLLYWKSRHVHFLIIAVDRGGQLEYVLPLEQELIPEY